MKKKVICGFPGVGKSHFQKKMMDEKNLIVADSDSSTFDKEFFPTNYIQHIKKLLNDNETDVILISSHAIVREALGVNQIDFTLVFPDISLKEEFIQRYKDRGSPPAFVELLGNNWDAWIKECQDDQNAVDKVILKQGEFLSDHIDSISDTNK